MNRIKFLGTADAFNSGARTNSCYWIDDHLGSVMVDFGPTALLQCHRLEMDLTKLDGIYLTHLHGDHIGGIAMLLVYMNFVLDRKRPFVIAGPPETEQRLALLRESAYPDVMRRGLGFPLKFKRWSIPGEVEILGRRVRAIRAVHDTVATATSLRVMTDSYSVAFSGDTGWQPQLAELARDVDVFVCECSNVKNEYWGHLSVELLTEKRAEIQVKQLVLTHLSVASREAALIAAPGMNASVADDGLEVELP